MDTRLLIEVESARLACTIIYDTTLAKTRKLVEQLAREPAAQELARRILTQGITVLQGRYSQQK